MKKIMMNKYGFERWPEEDFSDDGNRFTCYKVGSRVRVSKCTYNGKVFIGARIDGYKLPYAVYSSLPSYKELDKLNGVSIEALTDNDLINLYESCVRYEEEYTKAEDTIVLPTLEEITKHCQLIANIRKNEISSVEYIIKNNIANLLNNLSDYQWKHLKYYYNCLVDSGKRYAVTDYPASLLGTSQSIDLCKADYSAKKDSFYYKQLLELINSVKGAN